MIKLKLNALIKTKNIKAKLIIFKILFCAVFCSNASKFFIVFCMICSVTFF